MIKNKITPPKSNGVCGKKDFRRHESITQLAKQGITYTEIGKKFGITKQRVGQMVKQYDIDPRKVRRDVRYNSLINLVKTDLSNNVSISDIRNKHHLNSKEINVLFEAGIDVRVIKREEVKSRRVLCSKLYKKGLTAYEILDKVSEHSNINRIYNDVCLENNGHLPKRINNEFILQMGKEIERKFLLAKGASIPIPEKFEKYLIKQGYILAEKDKQVRIRISKWNGISFGSFCVKYTGKLIRDEFEFNIADSKLKEARELYKTCKWTIEKKRLSFDSHVTPKDVHYDVDTFPNGMQWIEVEFKSIKAMEKWEKNIPHWVGEEITGVNKYSNITLAKKNLKW